MASIQEKQRWAQALETMETVGVLELTLEEYIAVVSQVMEAERQVEYAGATLAPGTLAPSSRSSAIQAARSYCLRRLTAAHSALLSLTETYGFVSGLTVRRVLESYTVGQWSVLEAWAPLAQLALLDDLGWSATAPTTNNDPQE